MNQIFNEFHAYELNISYSWNKKIFNKFLLSSSLGFINSNIENYSATAIASDIKLLTKLKSLYIAFAMNNIGRCYEIGIGVLQDYHKAFEFYKIT